VKRTLVAFFVLLLVSPVHADLKHRVLRGDVVVRNNGGDLYNLVVLVDAYSRSRKRDGNVDYVIGIRSDASYGLVHERLRGALVTVDGNQVTIQSSTDERVLILTMPGEAAPEWLDREVKMRTFTGHSLVASEGNFGAERSLGGRIDAGDPLD
jgi:hypothetical protein